VAGGVAGRVLDGGSVAFCYSKGAVSGGRDKNIENIDGEIEKLKRELE
jgi:hypothetical protein